MKNTLHSLLFFKFNSCLKVNKKPLVLLLFLVLLFNSNLINAQLPVAYDFEDSSDYYQGWTSNGNRSGIFSSSTWSCSGNNSIYSRRNQTNNNQMTSPQLDLTNYSDVTISFCHKSANLDNGEGFLLEFYDGSNWVTIQNYRLGTDFNDQGPNNFSNTITTLGYSFASTSRFRFTGTGSSF